MRVDSRILLMDLRKDCHENSSQWKSFPFSSPKLAVLSSMVARPPPPNVFAASRPSESQILPTRCHLESRVQFIDYTIRNAFCDIHPNANPARPQDVQRAYSSISMSSPSTPPSTNNFIFCLPNTVARFSSLISSSSISSPASSSFLLSLPRIFGNK